MVKNGHALTAATITEFGFSNPDFLRAGVEALTYSRLNSRITREMAGAVHRTDFHQIFLITAGTGAMMIDFVDYPCAPGRIFQVSPGRVLRLPRATGPSGAPDALVVLFTPAFAPVSEATRALLSPFGPTAWTLTTAERHSIGHTTRELLAEYGHAVRAEPTEETTVELLRQLLGVLLLRIARLPAPDGFIVAEGVRGQVFRRFQHELERSFGTTRNAADYAARLGYSLRSLNRACVSAAGHTAKTLIDARVALEAKRLLTHTELPVATIGRRLGFTEPTNFGKFFSRETGYSPGAFRTQGRA